MRETTTKRIKLYSKLTRDIAAHTLYWAPVIACVYVGLVYHHVYRRTDK
jgi:hypothetical protein